MSRRFSIYLLLLSLFLFGCAESYSNTERTSLNDLQPMVVQKGSSLFPDLLYRYTDSSSDDLREILVSQPLWEKVPNSSGGHSIFPSDGYHWYALRLENASVENISAYLSVISVWWTEYRAWEVIGDIRGNSEIREIQPMKLIGLRYPLMVPSSKKVTLVFRTRVRGPSLTQMEYTCSSAKRSTIEEPSVMIGLFLGFMVLMLIYNLGFFLMLRERTYLYFCGLIFSVGGLILDEFGFWDFIGLKIQHNIEAVTWLTLCVVFTALTFRRIVYERDTNDRWSRILTMAVQATAVSWLLYALTATFLFYATTTLMHMVVGTALLFLTWRGWLEKKAFMANLMVAVLPMALVSIYVPIMRAGLLPELLEWPYLHLWIALFFQTVLCSILPMRFQKELASRELLHQSLEEKEQRFSEINDEVRELVERFKRLEDEDKFIRETLTSTQESRMDAQRKLRDARQQLRHLEYHVSLGRLVAGVAHDIGNPATHISGCVQSFRTMVEKLEPAGGFVANTSDAQNYGQVKRACSKLEEESSYIVRVNRALARYGRIDDSAAPGTNIPQVTEQVLCVLASRLREHEVVCEFDTLPELTAKSGQISQLLANLILNAIDAVDSVSIAGRIVVQAKVEFVEEQEGVTLTVQDNGPGIPELIRRSGFRPFVTTRNPAKWLGIGLSIAKRIVEEHGGEIGFPQSTAVSGGFVRVWLPVGRSHG